MKLSMSIDLKPILIKRRVNVLIFQLLSVKGYLTAQQLADELLVSRNTIVSDLEQVERLLQAYDLTLIRQARQGFTISGEESNVRLLMEFITQKNLQNTIFTKL